MTAETEETVGRPQKYAGPGDSTEAIGRNSSDSRDRRAKGRPCKDTGPGDSREWILVCYFQASLGPAAPSTAHSLHDKTGQSAQSSAVRYTVTVRYRQ